MDCIIKNAFGDYITSLYQYDKNQTINIVLKPENKFTILSELTNGPDIEVHFWTKNSKRAKSVTGSLSGNTVTVAIPNAMLEEGKDINLFVIFVRGNVENTVASATIPVIPRIEKEDIIP